MTRIALVGLGLAALVLSGCSGGDDASGSQKPSASASASAYLPVPDGVELTPQGSKLAVGDSAVVAFEPRQDEVGVLELDVTKIERTTVKATLSSWQLSAAQRASTPYFVHVTATNDGSVDLGGRRVPLYAVSDQNLLLESTPFASSFTPCPSTALPKPFRPGASADVCLVYLAPAAGSVEAISFRPEESFDPIVWTGEATPYVAPEPTKKPTKKAKKKR